MNILLTPEFWVAVSFVIFLGLALKAGAGRAVTKGLDSRQTRIASELAEAERLRKEAESLVATYRAKRDAAEQEAAEIVATARNEAERLAAEARTKAEEFVARRTKIAETKIAQAEAQAITEVRVAAADAAIAAASSVLAARAGGDAGDALINAAIKDVRGKLN